MKIDYKLGKENLRKKAELLLNQKLSNNTSQLSETYIQNILHEYEVHQIELELQNEELILANEQAEAAVEKYTDLYDFAPSGYITLSKDGEIVELNLCAAKMLGKERNYLIKNILESFVSNDSLPTYNNFLEKIFISKSSETCEINLSTYNDNKLCVYIYGIVAENEAYCQIAMLDITERKLQQEELIRSEAKFRSTFDQSPVGSVMIGLDNRFIRCNTAFCNFMGYTESELIGKTNSEFTYPEDRETGLKEMNQIIEK